MFYSDQSDFLFLHPLQTPIYIELTNYKRLTFSPATPSKQKHRKIPLPPCHLFQTTPPQHKKHLEAPYFIGVRGVSHSIFLYQFGYIFVPFTNQNDTK
jgi:hypothetical protein